MWRGLKIPSNQQVSSCRAMIIFFCGCHSEPRRGEEPQISFLSIMKTLCSAALNLLSAKNTFFILSKRF